MVASHVRFGSIADVTLSHCDVRSYPESRHATAVAECPLSAISGHRDFLRHSVLRKLSAGTQDCATTDVFRSFNLEMHFTL
jgi:hypothetical protein